MAFIPRYVVPVVLVLLASATTMPSCSFAADSDYVPPRVRNGGTRANSDENAAFLIQLFNAACIPNMGNSAGVHTWASEKHLPVITRPAALSVFVGAGAKGAAWDVPSPTITHFALSIRGLSEGCAVWAQEADPVAVEVMLTKELSGVVRPGLEVKKNGEKVAKTRVGTAKYVMYLVTSPDNVSKGFEVTLISSERPGAVFQASIQIAAVRLDH